MAIEGHEPTFILEVEAIVVKSVARLGQEDHRRVCVKDCETISC
jgi:hypothetical protein